jgi:hypothetical protein
LHSKHHTEVVADMEREMSREKPDLSVNGASPSKPDDDLTGLS